MSTSHCCPQSLGLALVHAHTRLAAENPGHNRTVEETVVKRLEGGSTTWPLKLTRYKDGQSLLYRYIYKILLNIVR